MPDGLIDYEEIENLANYLGYVESFEKFDPEFFSVLKLQEIYGEIE